MGALELKRTDGNGVAQALERAAQYRMLHEPNQAESICRDLIAVDGTNQHALRALILALLDQISVRQNAANDAREMIIRLEDAFDRAYYTGVVLERETLAYLERHNKVRSAAYDALRQAMEYFERAEALRPGNIDAVMRWNSCARAIEREQLKPGDYEPELPLE